MKYTDREGFPKSNDTIPMPPVKPAKEKPLIDYRELLIKYMTLVVNADGSTFLSHGRLHEFTDIERVELNRISDKAWEQSD